MSLGVTRSATTETPPINALLRVHRDGNPHRRHGFASPFTGKIAPVDDHALGRVAGRMLHSLPPLGEPTWIVGLAESSLMLAWAVAARLPSATLCFTTRDPIERPNVLAFREPHSHGPQHYLPLPDAARAGHVLVIEDEITTGATLRNLIIALSSLTDRVTAITLADRRSAVARTRMHTEMLRRGLDVAVVELDATRGGHAGTAPLPPPAAAAAARDPYHGAGHRIRAVASLADRWRAARPGLLYSVGECVDVPLAFRASLPEGDRPALRHVTLSPWKVDGLAIRSRLRLANGDGDDDDNAGDCAPLDPLIHHGATEACNGDDDDCDGQTDEGFSDLDGDGAPDCTDEDDDGDGVPDEADNCPVTPNEAQSDADGDGKGDACEDDADGDGDPDLTDCAKLDPAVHHGAPEACNGEDDNCNAIADEGFADTDGDGVADCVDPDVDGDGEPDESDCAPLDESVHPGAGEVCNGKDDNCDGTVDEGAVDTDGDGEADCVDADDDGDGEPDATDCAPLDPASHPGAAEACNGKDDDCDGQTDEEDADGCAVFYYNKDGDGFGIDLLTKCLCAPEAPFSADEAGDCNDQNPQVFPGANEYCNGKDDDCDEAVDEEDALGCTAYFEDGDLDGWGGSATSCLCTAQPGTSGKGGDCDDASPLIFPGAAESCNGVDDDCDSSVDEAGAAGCDKLYADKDDDGWGVATDSQCLCAPEGVYAAAAEGDCADDDPTVYPGSVEACDGKDNNCNGQIDEGVETTFYLDNDDDGYGASYNTKDACAPPGGYVEAGGDCNDFNAAISPNAPELCDEVDNNCNGQEDEGLPQVQVWVDLDGDGYGAAGTAGIKACLRDEDGDGEGETPPDGYALVEDDCDDSASTVYPGAAELCDGQLNDCGAPVLDYQCPSVCAGEWPVPVGVTSGYLTLAQMDSSNAFELVAQGAGQVSVLNADGSVKWSADAAVQYSHPMVADMDLDGWMDVVLSENGKARVLDGATGEELESHPTSGTGWRPGVVFDLDNDGVTDIVTAPGSNAPLTIVLRDGEGGAKDTLTIPPPEGAYFQADVPATADVDGDGVAEVIVGTGYSTCGSVNTPPCNGLLLVYDGATGELKADPLSQFVVPDAEEAYAGGPWPLTADLDADGELEVYHTFGTKSGAVHPVWDLDGSPVTPAVPLTTSSPRLAPIDGDGALVLDGTLADAGGGVADLDGDGTWEVVASSSDGVVARRGGEVMDGYPITVKAASPLIGDVNRDGRLDVLFIGAENAAVNCYTMGTGTFADDRLLGNGNVDALASGVYRTAGLDPFEPNDVRNQPFDPAASTDPVKDSRAFPMRGFVDKYSSSSGWSRTLRAMLGRAADRDYYWAQGSQIKVSLDVLTGPADHDLYVHMYKKVGGAYEHITTRTADGTGTDVIDCHWSDPCPDPDNTGKKTFIIEVRPKDDAVDYGPWPYRLHIAWGAK